MRDKSISFKEPMVRALLEGRKTQTRRVLKKQPTDGIGPWPVARKPGGPREYEWRSKFGRHVGWLKTPYAPGDRLWVREAWHSVIGYDDRPPRDIPDGTPVFYCAGPHPETGWIWGRPRPGMFMPRWASRFTLVVTDVRVQRLQDITVEDAEAEGIFTPEIGFVNLGERAPIIQFGVLWNSIYGPNAWDANPWVSAITFTVHHCNIDQMEKAA